jgi:hypothetical protein
MPHCLPQFVTKTTSCFLLKMKLKLGNVEVNEALGILTPIMINCVHQNHITLQLEFKKQFIYNYFANIPWVLQLLCNYHFENIGNY